MSRSVRLLPGAAAAAVALGLAGCGPVEDEIDRQREGVEREVREQGDRLQDEVERRRDDVRTQLDRLSVPTVPDVTVPDVTVPDLTVPDVTVP